MTQNVLEKEGISILREISPVPAVFVDAGQVQQILLNLILNAAQAMEGGGTVASGPEGKGRGRGRDRRRYRVRH
jgi:two-component system NtrC family sensor kinase